MGTQATTVVGGRGFVAAASRDAKLKTRRPAASTRPGRAPLTSYTDLLNPIESSTSPTHYVCTLAWNVRLSFPSMFCLRATPRYAPLVARSARASCLPPSSALGSLSLTRTYAYSRFEKPTPGVSRERPKVSPRQQPDTRSRGGEDPQGFSFSFSYEYRSSAEQSPLWEQSGRPPASNPEEGLRRLLMDNDRLVVTRCVRRCSMSSS